MADAQTQTARLMRIIESICLVGAFWPVWLWYVSRTQDASDEPWGLIALATAAFFLYLDRAEIAPPAQASNGRRLVGLLAIGIYTAIFPIAPNLVLSLVAIIALWYVSPARASATSRAGIAGLLVISLPLIPSLNFYGGYPMRLVTAAGAKFMLSCLGMVVSQQGTMLTVQDKMVAIDAPCSGISMVWAASYVSLLMATFLKLNGKKTLLLAGVAIPVVIAGNIIRAEALVLYDTVAAAQSAIARALPEPVIHLWVGLVIFALSAGVLVVSALKLRDWQAKSIDTISGTMSGHPLPKWLSAAQHGANRLLIPLCLIAALVPCFVHPSRAVTTGYYPLQWPTSVAGHKLTEVASLPEENAFAREFPGAMKRFTDGTNAYFIRSVNRETRQLHPSSDCFRGMGYGITFLPISVDLDGNRWNTFLATKSGLPCRSYVVTERLYDEHGQSWTDVSSWYWAAALGQSRGPWWAITVARQATQEELRVIN
jgi:exosortase/archaeosortase family protein